MAGYRSVAQSLVDDPRGNRLEKALVTKTLDERDHFLELLCWDEIAEQFFSVLWLLGRNPSWTEPDPEWTHRIRFDGPYEQWLLDLIELLQRVLTLRTYPQISVAIALDFHHVPIEPGDPTTGWRKTLPGQLVYRKYYKTTSRGAREQVDAAGYQLANRLVRVVRGHPLYASATRVIVVPSTSNPWKFGERLARGVAKRLDLNWATAVCLASTHHQAKQGHSSQDIEPYVIDGDVAGHRVLIVDDLYLTGQTLRDIASAALDDGAADVLALTGTRAYRHG
jgi:hypoxanthine-guanine phosphoribosyltransferase